MQPSPTTAASPSGRGALDRAVGRIAHAGAVLAAVAIVAVLVIVCAETMLRQFRVSLLVTDEIAGYLNAAAVFLGLAWIDGLPRQILPARDPSTTKRAIAIKNQKRARWELAGSSH